MIKIPSAAREDLITYIAGYILAIALTAASFGIVYFRVLPPASGFYTMLIIGLVQVIVHLRCFLHISLKRSARDDLHLLLFAALVIGLMVGGSLIIIFNLHYRMVAGIPAGSPSLP
jgi:cytochrome o ubiquinol oxidase subunit IV